MDASVFFEKSSTHYYHYFTMKPIFRPMLSYFYGIAFSFFQLTEYSRCSLLQNRYLNRGYLASRERSKGCLLRYFNDEQPFLIQGFTHHMISEQTMLLYRGITA